MPSVIDVHRKHIEKSIREIESDLGSDATAYEYFTEYTGTNDLIEDFSEFDLKTVHATHGSGRRRFMTVLNNPKFDASDHAPGSDNLHSKYEILKSAGNSSRNLITADVSTLASVATTQLIGYLEDYGHVFKYILDGINHGDPGAISIDDPSDHHAFKQYIQSEPAQEGVDAVDRDAGFFGDIHYTNRSKLQNFDVSGTSKQRMKRLQDEWLRAEIEAVDPEVIAFLGGSAGEYIYENDFERVGGYDDIEGDRGNWYEDNDGRVAIEMYHPDGRFPLPRPDVYLRSAFEYAL